MKFKFLFFFLCYICQLNGQSFDIYLSSADCSLCNRGISNFTDLPFKKTVYFTDSSVLKSIPIKGQFKVVYKNFDQKKSRVIYRDKYDQILFQSHLKNSKEVLIPFKRIIYFKTLKLNYNEEEPLVIEELTMAYTDTNDEFCVVEKNKKGRLRIKRLPITDSTRKELYYKLYGKENGLKNFESSQNFFETTSIVNLKKHEYGHICIVDSVVYSLLTLKIPKRVDMGKMGMGTFIGKESFLVAYDLASKKLNYSLIDYSSFCKNYDFDESDCFTIRNQRLILSVNRFEETKSTKIFAEFALINGVYIQNKLLKNKGTKFHKDNEIEGHLTGKAIFGDWFIFKITSHLAKLNSLKVRKPNILKHSNVINDLSNLDIDINSSVNDMVELKNGELRFLVNDSDQKNVYDYNTKTKKVKLVSTFPSLPFYNFYLPNILYGFNPETNRVEFMSIFDINEQNLGLN